VNKIVEEKLDELKQQIFDVEMSNKPMQDQFLAVFTTIHELLKMIQDQLEKTDESV